MRKVKKYLLLEQSIKKLLLEDRCRICDRELENTGDILCKRCFQTWKQKTLLRFYDSYYFVYFYEGKIREWIHEYKFGLSRPMGKLLAKLMKEAFWECYHSQNIDVVIPVPIHENRFLKRGFNQTEEILIHLKVPYLKIERQKDTKALFEHHAKKERQEIMKNAFVCPISLAGKNLLIFDDIVTTGTTMQEMKEAILQNGKPNKIIFFALALAERVKIEHKNSQN